MSKKKQNGLSSAELSNFCGQVALILEAGLPLYDGMETLAGADKGSENADIYESASKGVTETGSLYDAIKDSVPEVYIVGDANDPHRIADATKAGYRAACEI